MADPGSRLDIQVAVLIKGGEISPFLQGLASQKSRCTEFRSVKKRKSLLLQAFPLPGAYGIRTHGLNNANVARSQLR